MLANSNLNQDCVFQLIYANFNLVKILFKATGSLMATNFELNGAIRLSKVNFNWVKKNVQWNWQLKIDGNKSRVNCGHLVAVE